MRGPSISAPALTLLLLAAAVLPAPPAGLAQTQEGKRLLEQLMLAEVELEKARLRYPAIPASDLEADVRGRAGRLKVTVSELRSLPERAAILLPGGSASPFVWHRAEMAGRGEYGDVHLFAALLAGARPSEIEALALSAEQGGLVSFRLVLRILEASAVHAAASSHRTYGVVAGSDPRALQTALQQERLAGFEAALATLEAVVERRSARRLTTALAALEKNLKDHHLALRQMRVGQDVVVQGVAVGAAARAAVPTGLEASGLIVGDVSWSPDEGCSAFTATARLRPDAPVGDDVVGTTLFDERTAELCRPHTEATPVRRLEVGGAARPGAAIAMRVHEVPVADVFRVLNDLTGEDFVVDGGLAVRVSLETAGASKAEILDALPRAGLTIGDGPLRIVRPLDAAGTLPPVSSSGEPVTLLFNRIDIRDVLCVFQEISSLEILAAPAVEGRVTVYATDVPWDGALESILLAARLASVIDGTRVFIGPPGSDEQWRHAARPTCGSRRDDDPLRRLWHWVTAVDRLDASDLQVGALARIGNEWRAYAKGPLGTFWPLPLGTRLFGGEVRAVGEDGVTIAATTGAARTLKLPR